MKIAITGATGFIGHQLVPLLSKNNTILLIGRNKHKAYSLFPKCEFCEYKDIEKKISNFDMLIHLSVLNNNVVRPLSEFNSINVDLSFSIFSKANESGVKKIINFSTVHCLDERKIDNYTVSKRNLLSLLRENPNLNVKSILLPAVYGDTYANKLSFLNFFPKKIARMFFKLISAFNSTVDIFNIYEYIMFDTTNKKNITIISDNQNNNFFYKFYRKLLDISFSIFVIVFFWWFMILIGFIVKFSSEGPAIYKQKRVGMFMKEFTCYKFRTMKIDTPAVATHNIQESSVTKVGLFLRKFKLDELPQALNILRGEMSLIGPRPCLPSQIDLIKERKIRNVFTICPGITGLAAVNNIDMSNPKLLAEIDEEYLKMRSISFDMKIFIKTLLGSGFEDRTK